MTEVAHQLIGGEVDVVERDDARHRLFHHLRAPASLPARIEALATDHAELLPRRDEPGEMPPGCAIRVMVVIRPAKAQHILPRLLHAGCMIPPLPELPLSCEPDVACQVATE